MTSLSLHVPMLARSQHFTTDEDVAIILHEVTASTGLHIHEFFEIVYVERGSLVHLYGPTRAAGSPPAACLSSTRPFPTHMRWTTRAPAFGTSS